MERRSVLIKSENVALSEVWKEKGNVAIRENRVEEAFEAYNQALQANPLNVVVLSNRAQVFIQKGLYGQAVADCIRVLGSRKSDELDEKIVLKCSLRLAKASIELCSFEAAELHCNKVIASKVEPFCTAARDLMAKLHKKMRREADLAEEQIKKLSREFKLSPMMRKDQEDIIRSGSMSGRIKSAPTLGRRDPEVILPIVNALLKDTPVILRHGPHGFGIFAKVNIPAGTVVMVDPTCMCVHVDPKRCYHCMKRVSATNVTRCANKQCDRAFCSIKCKDEATASYHAPLCGKDLREIESWVSTSVSTSARFPLLAIKLLGTALQKRTADEVFIPDTPANLPPYNALWRMTDHEDEMEQNKVRLEFYDMVRRLLADDEAASCDPKLDLEWLLQVYSLLVPNTIGLSNPEGGGNIWSSGSGLMFQGSFFNHSCVSNTGHQSNINEGSQIQFITKTQVKAGKELVISYLDGNKPYEIRHGTLQAQYRFDCTCAKCTREGKPK